MGLVSRLLNSPGSWQSITGLDRDKILTWKTCQVDLVPVNLNILAPAPAREPLPCLFSALETHYHRSD
jgi:hypothetical protein